MFFHGIISEKVEELIGWFALHPGFWSVTLQWASKRHLLFCFS